ncbi:MAG: sigma-54-dependent Fis family transcriptional regulator [Candidatus Eisenbacteria sp.]|nr:sigma-54-dependent Fis family transcriptional regulator [Candidatus Eisenbacteria bacterium]
MESGVGIERLATRARVLVVDDDGLMRSFLEQALTRMGLTVQAEPSAEAALEAAGVFEPDLALLDVRLGGMDGITLLGRLATAVPDCNCIVMTAHGTIEIAIQAMKMGASDFLVKPFAVDALEVVVEKALGVARLKRENKRLRARLRRRSSAPCIVGKSRVMLQLQDLVRTVARSPATVLVEGESGTGKELIAQALHVWGPRKKGPFVKVNCAALPDGLMESELFGHDRGAFTGATGMLRGKFELADGGSLLLDEISEMEFVLQPKLLRSIQEKEFYRVGGSQPIQVDVRILATTNADLVSRVRDGMFREDLYYRLRVVPIQVPALRDRRDDIPLLAQHFLQTASAENGKVFEGIHKEAIARLMDYDWPGNVRELENMIQRAVVICPEAVIGHEHLLWDTPALPADRQAPKHQAFAAGRTLAVHPALPRTDGGALSALPDLPLRELERLWILRILEEEGGNKSRTARRLGINVRTIRNKLREWEDASHARAGALS